MKLSAAARKKVPSKSFTLPGKKSGAVKVNPKSPDMGKKKSAVGAAADLE